MKKIYEEITKKNSKTFYYSTIFFPKEIKKKVFLLYAFLRTTDDLVDQKKPDFKKFYQYKKDFNDAYSGKKVNDQLISDFVKLVREINAKNLIDDYFKSQEIDLKNKNYKTYKDLEKFLYGVSEVVGVFMAKILKLPKNSYPLAKKLGKAMQIINIIRDIGEDYQMGKVYIPQEDFKKFKINIDDFFKAKNLSQNEKDLIDFELQRAFSLYKEAEFGYKYFDKKNLLPVKIAANLYFVLGKKIEKSKHVIFNDKKIKLSLIDIIYVIFKNIFLIYGLNKRN
jgi:Phytoene/squalene synthetase